MSDQDDMMGRFFEESQNLLNEGKISLESIARLRNALYGPDVEPLDVRQMLRQHRELRN